MATTGGSNIVRNGLILELDAANRRSYVSGSTTWRDVSGNNYTGSLTNGPAFNSANGGNIVFDGSNDYVITSTNTNISSSNARTLSCWINPNSTYATGSFYSIMKIGNGSSNGTLFEILTFCSTSPTQLTVFGHFWGGGFAMAVPGTPIVSNQWYNIAMTYTDSLVSIYINAELKTTGSFTLNTSNTPLNLGQPQFGGHLYNKGLVSSGMVYNKSLSQQEVLQNYNAMKSRFNL
jgi:hypothetical protein